MKKIKPTLIFGVILLLTSQLQGALPSTPDTLTGKRLGWTPQTALDLCRGFYQEPDLNPTNTPLKPSRDSTTTITAQNGNFPLHGIWTAYGDLRISQPGRLITSDRGVVFPDPKTGQHNVAKLYGNVHLREAGKLVIGTHGVVNTTQDSGHIYHTSYRFPARDITLTPHGKSLKKIHGLMAWGRAHEMQQSDADHYHFKHATYSTCSPGQNSWRVHAKRLEINKVSGRGQAYGAWLTVHDIPIFYTPYFDFPIDNRRQTGLLSPTFIPYSSEDGLSLSLPYYLNLAPNYDATITPIYMSKRGLQINTDFRYLTPHTQGSFALAVLPHDRAFEQFKREESTDSPNSGNALTRLENASNTRYGIGIKNQTTFNDHWSGHIDYSDLSDDYFLRDLANPLSLTQNWYYNYQILREGGVSYRSEHWDLDLLLQGYQTLQQIGASSIIIPYTKLPEIKTYGHYHLPAGFELGLSAQYDNFQRGFDPSFVNPDPNLSTLVQGERLHLQPTLSRPFTGVSGYFTPQVDFLMTKYQLRDQAPNTPSNITRVMPAFSVRTGLYFDSNFHYRNTAYLHTLTPEIYYAYVPFHDQSNIPMFEPVPNTFYTQNLLIFNRLANLDRIGDGHQVTLSLNSTITNQNTGAWIFNGTLSESFYFNRRHVVACSVPGCINQPGDADNFPDKFLNAYLLTANGTLRVNPHWTLYGQYTFDAVQHKTSYTNLNYAYYIDQQHIINFGYLFLLGGNPFPSFPLHPDLSSDPARNDTKNLYASVIWPLYRDHWRGLATVQKNISHGHIEDYLFGVEYNSCCWAVRMMTGRRFNGFDENANPQFGNMLMLQFLLKGFSSVGRSDRDFLRLNFPYYKGNFIDQ